VQKLLNESKNKNNLVVKKSTVKFVSNTKNDNLKPNKDTEQLREILQDLQELKRLILDSS